MSPCAVVERLSAGLGCAPALERAGPTLALQQQPYDEAVRDQQQRDEHRHDEVGAAQPADLKSAEYAFVERVEQIGDAPEAERPNQRSKPSWGVAELAGQLDMDVSTATRNLRPLADAGFVTMRAGSRDARRREIRLSAKGGRTLERARPLWREAQRKTVAALGESRLGGLLTVLAALN